MANPRRHIDNSPRTLAIRAITEARLLYRKHRDVTPAQDKFGRAKLIEPDPVERMMLGAWSQIILEETADYCITEMLLRGALHRIQIGTPDSLNIERTEQYLRDALAHIEPLSSIVVTIAAKPKAGAPQRR